MDSTRTKKEPGRNELCPCGSGRKYKRCCFDPRIKELRFTILRLESWCHILLTQIAGMTGKRDGVVIPMEILRKYPLSAKPKIELSQDKSALRLYVDLPNIVAAPKKLIIPQNISR